MAGAGKNLDGLLSSLVSNLRAMEEKLKCLICKQLLREPTLMTCDHIFCKECIPKYMVSLCPICKARFLSKNLRPVLSIKEMLKIYQEMEASIKVINSYTVSPVGAFTGESEPIPTPQIIKRESGSEMNNSCQKDSTPSGIAIAPTGDGEFMPVPPGFEKRVNGLGSNSCSKAVSANLMRDKTSQDPSAVVPTAAKASTTPGASQVHAPAVRANASGTKDSCSVPCTNPSTSRNKRIERKELAGPSVKRPKLTTSRVPVGLFEDECIFCHSFRRNLEGLGELLCIQDGEVVSKPGNASKARVLYAHESCLHWAPEIYYQGDKLMNLESEIRRTTKLLCAKCGLKGASLGCLYEPCPKSYHPPCAFQVHGCRWDTENYNMLCPEHISKELLCDSGPPQIDTAANKNGHRPAQREWSNQPEQNVHLQKSKTNASTRREAHEPSKGKILVLLGLQLSQAEKEMLVQFSDRFSAILTKEWRNDVTHVVTSYVTQSFTQLRHAHEVMMAILHGTWIVTIEWIKASLEKERPVPEELYEVNQDSHGSLMGPRKGRMRATAPKAPNLFARFGFLLSKDLPLDTKRRIKELLVAGGGEVTEEGGPPLSGSNRRLLTTYLVYNGESAQESGSSRRMEQLLGLAKRKRCSRLVSHKRVEKAIVDYDIEVFNKEWYEDEDL